MRPENTTNPLDLWRSYRNHRESNAQIPDFVLQYFDQVAETLVDRKLGDMPKDYKKLAAEALGLLLESRGETSLFRSDFHRYRNLMIRQCWLDYKKRQLDSENALRISASLDHPDDRTIKDNDDFYDWAGGVFEVGPERVEQIVHDKMK